MLTASILAALCAAESSHAFSRGHREVVAPPASVRTNGLYGEPPFIAETPEMEKLIKAAGQGAISRGLCMADHIGQTSGGGGQCDQDYARLYSKSVIKVNLVIGYVDFWDTTGQTSYTLQGFNGETVNMGQNATTSPFDYALVRGLLTSGCGRNGSQLCGFSEVGKDVFEKRVAGVQGGPPVTFQVTLAQATASPFHNLNTSVLRDVQSEVSAHCEDVLFGGLAGSADIVLYEGHARNGGGPDCQPVVLRGNHADYGGYYLSNKNSLGYGKIRSALETRRSSGEPLYAAGILACRSNSLFIPMMKSVSPGSRFIGAGNIENGAALMTADLAVLDASMRKMCPDQVRQAINAVPRGSCDNYDNPAASLFDPAGGGGGSGRLRGARIEPAPETAAVTGPVIPYYAPAPDYLPAPVPSYVPDIEAWTGRSMGELY